MLNFRYVAGDGRLKKLNFVINSRAHLDKVLSMGERVDGSSLFSFVDANSSDLYVVPRYRTAFVNPFTEVPTLDLICSFYNNEGNPLESAPEYILRKAQQELKARTGCTLEALGELEYYLFSELDKIYPITEQKGYHESHPFSKWGLVRREAMKVISEMGGMIKYGHAEVGNIIHGDTEMVQQEIEFLPVPIEDAADQLVTAKWALREVAYKHGLEVSYAPKIIVGHAGSGMHFHTRLVKDGRNLMADEKGLTETARKVIAGYLMCAESLTAFGNTVPTSFLRLVPHQEAPTSICWGDRNRSVLVRVPLGWLGVGDKMLRDANPAEPADASFEGRPIRPGAPGRPQGGRAALHQGRCQQDARPQAAPRLLLGSRGLPRRRAGPLRGGRRVPGGPHRRHRQEPQGLQRPEHEREALRQRRLPPPAGEPPPALRLIRPVSATKAPHLRRL